MFKTICLEVLKYHEYWKIFLHDRILCYPQHCTWRGADWFASIGSIDVVRIRWELVRDTYSVYWVRNWGKRRNRLAADHSKTWVDGDKSNNELLTVDRRIISSTDKNRLHRYCKDVNSTFHVETKIVNFVWH